ncbi:hypothetical protein PR048_011185 [Dryococelus australis]|uniref:Uncharacterized protein n=1 Tax=Dryococelus australis TaxID=614101 RepID=A0ABQ9HKV1_9NEOP|nr:hypothetical protein PR048_011185 [Dryococelus australis]
MSMPRSPEGSPFAGFSVQMGGRMRPWWRLFKEVTTAAEESKEDETHPPLVEEPDEAAAEVSPTCGGWGYEASLADMSFIVSVDEPDDDPPTRRHRRRMLRCHLMAC